jgi:glycolate oxidase FAD binding subunit
MAGSWGRLAALTQVTLKVLPAPQVHVTKLISGLDIAAALRSMSSALQSTAEVAAAAHIPGKQPLTALLLKGFAPSVQARSEVLDDLLEVCPQLTPLHQTASRDFWRDVATATSLGRTRPLWRVNVAPSKALSLYEKLMLEPRDLCFDWGGALVWVAYEGDPRHIRTAAESVGGQAMLVRAPTALRELVPALHPLLPEVSALEERIRRSFDPDSLFETRRF